MTIARTEILHGDCVDLLAFLQPANSIDSIVTDPPYELGFMGKSWDNTGVAFNPDTWCEMLRVLKPGGYLLAFGGTRTYHRIACAIEDAGFEIRDCVMWIYGSGFPKSLNVQQAINKAARGCPQGSADPLSPNHGKFKSGCSEENEEGRGFGAGAGAFMREQGQARGDDAGPWQGWGTALKPAYEPIIVARKPLTGTVAANVLAFGTGAINIDGCRVPSEKVTGWGGGSKLYEGGLSREGGQARLIDAGRWPANIIHDGSDEVLAGFPDVHGAGAARTAEEGTHGALNKVYGAGVGSPAMRFGDAGSAARFFYCAKASKKDRNEGCEALPLKVADEQHKRPHSELDDPRRSGTVPRANHHPTVKPTELMRYLCRLVTPPGGLVLDPFAGSGSTGKAARLEGFRFLGIEREAEYVTIAEARIKAVA